MLERGTIVEGYRIDGLLGQGGMGAVYRATQLSLNREVALKVLAAELGDDPDFRARFQREGQIQAGLDHQNIVTVYEAGQSEQGLFLAMRLIDGPTLKELILRQQLDTRRMLRLLFQVSQALDEAHHAGLIHRDIKPQNILIGRGDHAYLADFGLTRAPTDAQRLTGSGQFVGTIDYIAPEQVQGDPPSVASDCYSLSAVLYECLSGIPPFQRPTETAAMRALLTEPPPRVTERRPDVSPAIDDVVTRGLAKDPSLRPSSAGELMREAARALGSTPASPATVVSAAQATRLSDATDAAALQATSGAATVDPAQLTRAGAAGVPGGATVIAGAPAADAAAPGTAQAPSPPAPAAPARPGEARKSRSGPLLVAALVAGIVFAAAGYLVGHGSQRPKPPSFTNSATAGHLQLRYPASWQLGGPLAAIPGIGFSEPVKLSAGGGAGLWAGEVTSAGGPTLLSPSLRSHVSGQLSSPQPVEIGSLQGYRYSSVHVKGVAAPLTLYAFQTTAGVATLACVSAAAAPAGFDGRCDEVVATLQLVATKPFALGPDSGYAQALSRIFSRLNTSVAAAQKSAQAASTPASQAAAESALSRAYRSAAASVSAAGGPPAVADARSAVIASLKGLSAAYSRAASAARSGSAAAYGRASSAVAAQSSALGRALRGLAALGYKVS